MHTKRLEDNLNWRNEFANPETTFAVPSVGRTDVTKRARQDELETPQESANTGRVSSSSAGVDVYMRVIHVGKRPLDPGGDQDMVCGLDVCDEFDENSFVNDREGDCSDEVTGVTLLRDDVVKVRMKEMRCCEKFEAYEEATNSPMCVEDRTQTRFLSMERHQHR